MKKLALVLALTLITFTIANAQTSSFTYQGKLTDGSVPASGTFEMRFKLFDALTGGIQQPQPTPITLDFTVAGSNPVTVTNGIFTVQLDFSATSFPAADRFIEVSVRHNSTEAFTLLNPRQPLTSSPYAIKSANAASADTATNSTQLGGVAASQYVITTDPRMTDARPPTMGSDFYIQNRVTQQPGSFNIAGRGIIGNGLGIGTSDPQNLLHLNGNSSNFAITFTNNANMVGRRGYRLAFDNNRFTFQKADDSGLFPVNQITIDQATGNLGIGTIAPTEALDVVGNVKISGAFSGKGVVPWQVVSGNSQQAQPNTGYLATNDAQVTVTLPASPAIGDIIRVSAMGTGGWKIAQNPGQFISTLSFPLVVTLTADESNRSWYSVASSADGTKLVAVDSGGRIYTSTDSGIGWTPRESNRAWYSVASSADGTKLVAVETGGQIYTSTDSGISWTPRESSRAWYSVASSADGTKLVAAVYQGQIYTSTDSGVSWTPRNSNTFWIAVASSADGAKLVAVTQQGSAFTSNDSGINWTPHG